MINRFIKKHSKNLYIFFLFLSLVLFFFSTDKVYAKSFNIKNIEVSKPFEINFDKKRHSTGRVRLVRTKNKDF